MMKANAIDFIISIINGIKMNHLYTCHSVRMDRACELHHADSDTS